jgi:glycosyltransferase involved in cell wall biosynthesis
MGVDSARPPRVSVVIPTYNRCELLRVQLEHLTGQELPVDEFEVIVADDGSSDGTRAMVESFTGRLRLKYHHQEDLGNRVGTARNAGAALAAAPVLVFLDTGPLFGRDFLRQHLALHADESRRRAVIGYAHGYNPEKDLSWVRDEVARLGPEATVARYADDPDFRDLRLEQLADVDYDLSRRLEPWQVFFSLNISLRTDDFRAVGGFDEAFNGYWGAEDLELGFKLFRRGLEFCLGFDAWVVDVPHARDMSELLKELVRQFSVLLDLHREPLFEIGVALMAEQHMWEWDAENTRLVRWRREVGDRGVAAEIADAIRDLPAGAKVAVIGSGGDIPQDAPPMVVMDFDRGLAVRAANAGRHIGHHVLGLRTPLLDQSVDTVVITSRLAGLWERWGGDLLAEARRVGRDVRVFAAASERVA